jgi:hypothetical protein
MKIDPTKNGRRMELQEGRFSLHLGFDPGLKITLDQFEQLRTQLRVIETDLRRRVVFEETTEAEQRLGVHSEEGIRALWIP